MDPLLAHIVEVGRLMDQLREHYENAQLQSIVWHVERVNLERELRAVLQPGDHS